MEITTFAAEIFAAVLGGWCHFFYNYATGKYKRFKLEKRYPVAGEYITTYEDEVDGVICLCSAQAILNQDGDRVTGKTSYGETIWNIDGHIVGHNMVGRYTAESQFNEGIGTFFLRIKDNGILEGMWSGYDAANNKISSGRYMFKRTLQPMIKKITEAELPSILRIAERQLGDSYVNETSLLGDGRYGFYATIDSKIVGFSVGRIMRVDEFLSAYEQIRNRDIRSLGAAELLGFLTCIAVDEHYKKRGIGDALLKRCIDSLIDNGAQVLASTAWKSKKGVHIGGLMNKNGFEQIMEIEKFWHDDSIANNYQCPECGKPPCNCSAVFYIKHISNTQKHDGA